MLVRVATLYPLPSYVHVVHLLTLRGWEVGSWVKLLQMGSAWVSVGAAES